MGGDVCIEISLDDCEEGVALSAVTGKHGGQGKNSRETMER